MCRLPQGLGLISGVPLRFHFKTPVSAPVLALDAMPGAHKAELLLALERPDLPLHNNLSEGDIREHVKRRKISGGTRSEDGRRCRDTFSSLKKTCRKLKVSFWKFLNDRTRGKNQIPALPTLIEAQANGP